MERTSKDLSQSLKDNGFELIRLKTGAPPRVLASSIDFSEVEYFFSNLKANV